MTATRPAPCGRREQVDARVADEARDLEMGGIVVDLLRRADLQQRAADHHGHAIGHAQRLGLVVGDVEGRHAGAAVQLDDLAPRMDAEVGVEVGQRLVHQEGAGLAHHGARQRHALALAAGHLAGLAVEQVRRSSARPPSRATSRAISAPDGFPARQQAADERQALRRREAAHGERHGDVLARRQMRIERVGLEHHGDVAVGRRQGR